MLPWGRTLRAWAPARAHSGAAGEMTMVAKFKADYEAYLTLKSTEPMSVAMQLFLRRSTFATASTKQFVEMFQLTNWTMTRDITHVMHSHTGGLLQTQIIEDIIGQQKNDKRGKARQGLRRPVASWCAALAANVLMERHAFKTVSSDTAMFSKAHKLAPEMFKPSKLNQSLPFDEVASVSQQAPYWSPKPENNMLPTSDLVVAQEFARTGQVGIFTGVDAGAVCDFSHHLVLRRSMGEVLSDRWWLALAHFNKSAVMVLPCRRLALHNNSEQHVYYELDLPLREPQLLCLYDIAEWSGATIKWRSCAWQLVTLDSPTLKPCVRAFESLSPAPLFQICCRQAFWALPKSTIEMLAKQAGLEVESGWGLFEALEKTIQQGLKPFLGGAIGLSWPVATLPFSE